MAFRANLLLLAVSLHAQSSLPVLLRGTPRLQMTAERIPVPAAIGYPTSAAMHPNGLLYVLHRNLELPPVIALDMQSRRIVHQFGQGMFQIPHSIRIHPDGRVFTVDAASSQIHQFTPEGGHLGTIEVGGQPKTASPFNGATDVAFAPDGRLFVSDGYGNARVLIYSAGGRLLGSFGSPGAAAGQFAQPHSLAILNDTLYVADRRNNRLQLFTLSGRPVAQWDHLGMVTAVTARGGQLWIGTQSPELPTSADGYLVQLEPKTGRVLAHIESGRAHHVLNLTDRGEPVSGARPDHVYLFRRR